MAKPEKEKPLYIPATNDPRPFGELAANSELAQKSAILSQFLQGSVDSIRVDSVLPISDVAFMYSVSLFRQDGEGNIVFHQTDSGAVNFLRQVIELSKKNKKKKYKQVIRNLDAIKAVVTNPIFWNKPFNKDEIN